MSNEKDANTFDLGEPNENGFDLQELVLTIGYQLTAYIGRTNIRTVQDWMREGLPQNLQARMRAALEVAKPIAEVESEFVAQSFLREKRNDLEPYRFPATMLRDADVATARSVLIQYAKSGFLNNVASDLETVAQRLEKWAAKAKMPPRTGYSVHLWGNRLSLSLQHAGWSLEQQEKWDKGKDWPCWKELVAEIPEMAKSRTVPDLQTGCPYRYLRRSTQPNVTLEQLLKDADPKAPRSEEGKAWLDAQPVGREILPEESEAWLKSFDKQKRGRSEV